MAGLLFPDILGAVNQGYDRGQNQQFNKLAGQAVADPDNASSSLGLAAAINPGKALAIQSDLQGQNDAKLKKIGNAANYVLQAYKSGNPQQVQGAYQAVRPFLQQLSHEHGDGMEPPGQFSEDMLPHLYQLVGEAGGDTAINGTLPGGVREFNAMSQNLSPEDRIKAQRINLGLDARAVTGAAKSGMITGADGRERPFQFDPSTRSYKVFDGANWRELDQAEASQVSGGAQPGAPSAAPQLAGPVQVDTAAQANELVRQGVPPDEAAARVTAANREQLGAGVPSIVLQADGTFRNGTQGDKIPQTAAPVQTSIVPPGPASTGGSGSLGVGRAPEETAGAVQNAKNASDVAFLPQQEAIKNNAAVDAAGRTVTAKGNAERALDQPQAQSALQDAASNLDRLANTARRVMNHPGLKGVTSWQARIPDVPGSDAANARAELQSLKSQIGFSVLQAMRNASKTGGALGSVSDSEQSLLQSNLAALEQSQSPEAFKENLQRVIDFANGAKGRLGTAYSQTYSSGQSAPAAPAAAQHAPVDDLLSKYGVH